MSLLTKDERHDLGPRERRALRRERRDERRDARDGDKLDRDLERWGGDTIDRLEALVREMAETDIDGEAKLDEVVDTIAEELAPMLDDKIRWVWLNALVPVGPFIAIALERADGPFLEWVLRGLLRPVARRVYRGLHGAGEV